MPRPNRGLTARMQIMFTPSEAFRIIKEAGARGVSCPELVRRAIRAYLGRNEAPATKRRRWVQTTQPEARAMIVSIKTIGL